MRFLILMQQNISGTVTLGPQRMFRVIITT